MQTDIATEVLVLFLIMAAGYYARRRKFIDATTNRGITELILNVTLPMMVVVSFTFDFNREMLSTAMKLLMVSFGLHVALYFISGLFFRRHPQETRSVLRFMTIFSNSAFMGYPVLQSLYGKIGIFYASIFGVPFTIALWSLGVMLFTGEKGPQALKKALINPGVLAVVAGLVIFIGSIKLPPPLLKACELVGSTTTPLSMIVVGATLADTRLRDLFSGLAIYYGSAVRLLLVPLLVLAVLSLLGIKGMVLGICVVSMAMPAAANTAMFAEKYDGDTQLASRCIFLSTALSLLTIPLVIAILHAAMGEKTINLHLW